MHSTNLRIQTFSSDEIKQQGCQCKKNLVCCIQMTIACTSNDISGQPPPRLAYFSKSSKPTWPLV